MSRLALLALLATSCASKQQLPPGNELEHAPEDGEEGGADGVSNMPKADRDLASAFEPEKPKAAKAAVVVIEPDVPSPAVREEAKKREAYGAVFAEAQALLKQKKGAEAAARANEAAVLAEELSPAERTAALELTVKGLVLEGDGAEAVKAAERWLVSCGPEKTDSCRGKAIAAIALFGGGKKAVPGAREKVRWLKEHDACVQKSEREVKAEPCLGAAKAFYQRQKDELMAARVELVKGLEKAREEKAEAVARVHLAKAEGECGEKRCAAVRRRALKALSNLAARESDLEGAAKYALQEMKVAAELLPVAERGWARTDEADKACAALDAKAGAHACRKLEKRVNGEWVFRDFSQQRAGEGLSGEQVKQVNEHFAALIDDCLSAQAERLRPPNSETYGVRWVVTNEGRVGEVHLDQKALDQSPLASCLRKQFVAWRYPKYSGEYQHVEQRFTVSARERRR